MPASAAAGNGASHQRAVERFSDSVQIVLDDWVDFGSDDDVSNWNNQFEHGNKTQSPMIRHQR